MKPTITTYQYSYITQQVDDLVSAELSVNDAQIRAAVLAKILDRITPLLPTDEPVVSTPRKPRL